jgi:hypothetical protein
MNRPSTIEQALDVPCTQCLSRAGADCKTPTGKPRQQHAVRVALARSTSQHRPADTRDGWPVAVPLELSAEFNRQGNRTVKVLCPLCWQTHRHGWDATEDTDWTHRAAHCNPALVAPDNPGGYLLPPTRDLDRQAGAQ